MQRRIAGNDRPAKKPFLWMFDQSVLPRIVHDVKADLGKSVSFALFGSQDVIVRLVLEAMRAQFRSEVFTYKLKAVPLISVAPHAHPNQVNVIRHQAISWAEQSLTRSGVEHDLTEVSVECIVQPAGAAQGDRHRPMNHGIGLIILAWKTLQVEGPICA